MPMNRFLTTGLLAAATVASTTGLFTIAAPAQAAPGDCEQWGWPGEVVLLGANGFPELRFNSTGPNASGAASWVNNLGKTVPGTITGTIAPNGAVSLTYQDND